MNMQSMMASALSSRLKLFLISGDERTLQVENFKLNIDHNMSSKWLTRLRWHCQWVQRWRMRCWWCPPSTARRGRPRRRWSAPSSPPSLEGKTYIWIYFFFKKIVSTRGQQTAEVTSIMFISWRFHRTSSDSPCNVHTWDSGGICSWEGDLSAPEVIDAAEPERGEASNAIGDRKTEQTCSALGIDCFYVCTATP